jgi:hypothetical protein
MVRSGARQSLSRMLLFALAGIVLAYYAMAGSLLLAGAMSMLLV